MDSVLHRKTSVQRQRRWIENVTEWTGLKRNEVVWIPEERHWWYDVLASGHRQPSRGPIFKQS